MTNEVLAPETDQTRRFSEARRTLAISPLVRSGGLLRTRIPGLDLGGLVRDAFDAHRVATEARSSKRATGSRGNPDRWLESGPGGQALNAFAASDAVLDTLVRATGASWQPAGPGSWSYYRQEGHYLGLHRDLAVCDLALITCVYDEGRSDERGQLRTWPTRTRASLEEIHRDPAGARTVRLLPGESVLLLGGFLPHEVSPLASGHVRIVAPLCYQVLPCDC